MTDKDMLSIYVPKGKLRHRPVERLTKLAEERERSVNYLAVEAILQYLEEHEPLDSMHAEQPTSTAKPKKASKPSSARAHEEKESPAGDTREVDEQESEATHAVSAYAAEVAAAIDRGERPAYVQSNERGDKIQVVISRAVPPKDTLLSDAQWREHFRLAISVELSKLGWQIKGGNRFWRPGAESRSRQAASPRKPATQSGCLGLCALILGALSLVAVFAVGSIMNLGIWSSLGPVAMGLLLLRR